jgi:hypothetical protein
MSRFLLISLLTLASSALPLQMAQGSPPATSASPARPYQGEWCVDIEQSYGKAVALKELASQDPAYLRSQIEGMSKLVRLAIGDSTITFTRGRHRRELAYQLVEAADSLGVTLLIAEEPEPVRWHLLLSEAGFLELSSTREGFVDYFVYVRADSTTPAPSALTEPVPGR